jgi:peptidoglycan/xylan/chitin deacetylase (PgdA/CDA1 family)
MLASTQTSDNSSGLATSALVHQSGLSALANEIEPILVAHLSARPFPEINERARLAKVPVIMYHDILPEKKVFFDVTPQEFEQALQLIRQEGLTPISLDQLVEHLSTGMPLPEKPILLTFDDGYAGHYTYVYPLLKKYGYPGVFAIYTKKVGTHYGRSAMTWAQIREMAADPLVTIASHSLTHPPDLGKLDSNRIRDEVVESKRILEEQLGIPIKYFVYPEGKYNEQVKREVRLAGYQAALTMNDEKDLFAGDSDDLLSIDRIGQSGLKQAIEQAYGGPPSPSLSQDVTFDAPIRLNRLTVDKVPLMMASGGQPITLHANSRYQVKDIIAKTDAVAAVDGGFFSLEYLDSNVMVGPVYSQSTGKFVPGNVKEIRRISGRPLVLISPTTVKFVPFDPTRHNTLEGIQAELPDVTDAFVAAAWLVKDGDPQPARTFGNLFDFDAARDRAYWGINQAGQPVVGVSGDYVDSVTLGRVLSQVGMRDVVMLDSGASASLVYKGKSLMGYEPRPVPHVVALLPPRVASATCATTVSQARAED